MQIEFFWLCSGEMQLPLLYPSAHDALCPADSRLPSYSGDKFTSFTSDSSTCIRGAAIKEEATTDVDVVEMGHGWSHVGSFNKVECAALALRATFPTP
jgi:hypothetical protein